MAGPETISFLRTECYSAGLTDQVQAMREEECFTDFAIKTGKESFPCHRVMISAHSPVIKAALTHDTTEAARKSVSYDHISAETLKVLLNYMYLGQIFFHVGLLMDVVTACDYLQMNVLMQRCLEEVPAILKPANVIAWVNLATQLNLTALREKCTAFMVQRFADISKLPDFLAMSYAEVQEYMHDVLKSDMERDEVLQAVMRWVNHDTDQRLAHLENLLKQIEVENCSQPGILDVMHRFGTLILACKVNVLNLLTTAMKESTPGGKQTVKSKTQGTLLIIGGQIGPIVSRVCWKLNPAKLFVKLCDIPFNALEINHSVCKTADGFAITGGIGSDLAILFNAATRSWTKLKKMLAKRCCHGSICIRGVLYVFGGPVGGSRYGSSKSVESLAMEGGRWQRVADLPIDVDEPKVADINDSVYLLDAVDTKQLLQLEVKNKVWQRRASSPVGGYGVSMIAVNGQLCVAGGSDRICAQYNIETDTWSVCQQPSFNHYYGSLCYYDTALLLLGGKYDDDGTAAIEEYNIEDDTWAVSGIKMPARLCDHHALVLDMPLQED